MTNPDIEAVAEVVEEAHGQFMQRNQKASASIGIISSKIRAMGIAADAVNIDDVHSKTRLVLIVLDQDPGKVGMGIGQIESNDYEMITQLPVSELLAKDVLEVLEARFSLEPASS
ncbi:MAG: hypothetical protein R3217_10540 [Gammaproteobacteria bacterium]|nr:hypothetical protein [Gammaproteobacteria bacterium]